VKHNGKDKTEEDPTDVDGLVQVARPTVSDLTASTCPVPVASHGPPFRKGKKRN